VIDFGKHKGKRVSEVDTGYLEWAARQAKQVADCWRERFAQQLRRRGFNPLHRDTDTPAPSSRQPMNSTTPPAVDPVAAIAAPAMTKAEAKPLAVEGGLLSPEDVARLLKVHRKTVLRMRQSGRLPRSLDGLGPQAVRWGGATITAWIAAGMPSRAAWEQTEDNRGQPGTTEDANRE
jgi:predicted DNA-binding transcriptional regulator AlpA